MRKRLPARSVLTLAALAIAAMLLAQPLQTCGTASAQVGADRKANKQSKARPKRSAARTPGQNPSPKERQILGAWRANVSEFGNNVEITWTFNHDGSAEYTFRSQEGLRTAQSTWRYTDGTIYEKVESGKTIKGSVRWVNKNTFELTIIDNGYPEYSGVKRLYRRVK